MNQFQEIAREVREAGRMALQRFGRGEARRKEDGSLVTPADRAVEDFLRQRLSARWPGLGFLGEETGPSGSKEDFFILDPIDGTAAYAAGLPVWGPCLGLWRRECLEAGWFHLPTLDELYLSTAEGICCNQRLIRPATPLEPLLLAPSSLHREFRLLGGFKVRSFGCTAAHLLYVALGRASAALFGRVHIWDLAGVLPGFLGTGGQLLFLDGREIAWNSIVRCGRFPAPFLALPAGTDADDWLEAIRPLERSTAETR